MRKYLSVLATALALVAAGQPIAQRPTTATDHAGWQQVAEVPCAGQQATDGSGCAKQQGAG